MPNLVAARPPARSRDPGSPSLRGIPQGGLQGPAHQLARLSQGRFLSLPSGTNTYLNIGHNSQLLGHTAIMQYRFDDLTHACRSRPSLPAPRKQHKTKRQPVRSSRFCVRYKAISCVTWRGSALILL